ncbi:hypothetical protein KQY30_35890 [Streptomyces sp. GMY02]|uniref:hypothetical protein n=1 Tax=Streptomyces sp. GMY02 TaxID=1333528 RepID=UPI001C2C71AC|nr:hypothetical protein [Streptomyces sp. GMY02]QXE38785.1 hypothetical protein KQY30_35890 [Streptomyces sp. GMY02]
MTVTREARTAAAPSLVVLSEELRGEVDDRAGDALRRVRPGLRPDPQGGHEDAPQGLQGEGVLARLTRVRAGRRGDRDDDPGGDVDEQLGNPRLRAGELASGAAVVGLDGPEVVEGADGPCGQSPAVAGENSPPSG